MECSEPRLQGSTHVPRPDPAPADRPQPAAAKPRAATDLRAAQYLREQQLNIRMNAGPGDCATELLEIEALGRVTLARELEAFGPWDGQPYDLETADRDRLLAQGRSDTAASYAILRSLLCEAAAARRRDRRIGLLLALSLAANGVVLAMLLG
ncbi:MAG: hypothetical protein V7668_10225 [Cereibacter changlensis]